ncbi:hypothetical protein QEN19_003810 [Hanseniaspora menglaensis]
MFLKQYCLKKVGILASHTCILTSTTTIKRCASISTKEAKPLPSTVKGFLTRPGHEVTGLLDKLNKQELEIQVGPEFNDDVLIYHKLISNTDIPNLTLKLIRQFENKMLGINKQQLENRVILNDTFNVFLKRKQYVKYFLLLRRTELLKNRIVPLNMILQHYIVDLKDLDSARRIYLKFTKLGQLPNDATMTIMFKAYNVQFSNKSKFAVSLDSRNETFYKNLIMKLLFEKHKFCSEIKDYDTVVKNAFRFSCYRLPLQFSLQLLNKIKRNEDTDSNAENYLYLDSVNMFWRGMGIKSLYYNRFDKETRLDLYRQANENDSEALTLDNEHDREEMDSTVFGEIDEKTGSFKVTESDSEKVLTKMSNKMHPDYTLILNFNKFKDFLDLFVAKQKRVSEMGLHEIVTMLNSRSLLISNKPEEKHYFQNIILNLIYEYFKPMTEEFGVLVKNRIDENIPFIWKLDSLKKQGNDTKYLMNAHTFEQIIKLSSELKDKFLYRELLNILVSPERHFQKLQQDYNFSKWLLSLNKIYSNKQLNDKRRETLETILPHVAMDLSSMTKFYYMNIPKWFNDQCLAGDLSKEDLAIELQKVTRIFVKFVEEQKFKITKEEIILMSKTTFKEYLRKYRM